MGAQPTGATAPPRISADYPYRYRVIATALVTVREVWTVYADRPLTNDDVRGAVADGGTDSADSGIGLEFVSDARQDDEHDRIVAIIDRQI